MLTEAAINGAKDHLIGLKENVIIGKLIPAGTGAEARRLQAERAAQLSPADEEQQREEAAARAFLSGDPDADGDGEVEPDEAEAAAAEAGDTVADLMGAGSNPEMEAAVEEAVFDVLTEEPAEPRRRKRRRRPPRSSRPLSDRSRRAARVAALRVPGAPLDWRCDRGWPLTGGCAVHREPRRIQPVAAPGRSGRCRDAASDSARGGSGQRARRLRPSPVRAGQAGDDGAERAGPPRRCAAWRCLRDLGLAHPNSGVQQLAGPDGGRCGRLERAKRDDRASSARSVAPCGGNAAIGVVQDGQLRPATRRRGCCLMIARRIKYRRLTLRTGVPYTPWSVSRVRDAFVCARLVIRAALR